MTEAVNKITERMNKARKDYDDARAAWLTGVEEKDRMHNGIAQACNGAVALELSCLLSDLGVEHDGLQTFTVDFGKPTVK